MGAVSFFSDICFSKIIPLNGWEDFRFSSFHFRHFISNFRASHQGLRSRLSPSVYRVKEIIIIRYRRPIPLYCTSR